MASKRLFIRFRFNTTEASIWPGQSRADPSTVSGFGLQGCSLYPNWAISFPQSFWHHQISMGLSAPSFQTEARERSMPGSEEVLEMLDDAPAGTSSMSEWYFSLALEQSVSMVCLG